MSELSLIATKLEEARCPEDVFGGLVFVKTNFHMILRKIHPDKNGGSALAQSVTERLLALKAIADERIKARTYGSKLPLPEYEEMKLDAYNVLRKPIVGDLADLYLDKKHVVKVARSADDNDLLRAERSALELLNAKVTTMVRAGFPTLANSLQVGGREANVLERVPQGFLTAQEVRARLPKGVDGRALVWMFKRLLTMLDWTHHLGLVHGAVLPPHVLFYPDNDGTTTNPHPYKHTARLVGWCASVEHAKRTRLSTWSPAWEGHYPPELILKKSVGPSSDIYMATKLIMYLAGGEDELSLPTPLGAVLYKCWREEPERRYQSCAEVMEAWMAAAEKVYGHPKWVDFNVPR